MFYRIGLILNNGQPLYVGDAMHGSAWHSPIWQLSFEKYYGLALWCDEDEVKQFYYPLVHIMLRRKDVKSVFICWHYHDKECHKTMTQHYMIDDSGDIVPFR